MILYYSPTSPYARKARAVIIEKRLQKKVREIALMPYENPKDLLAANPLGKVPTLIMKNGEALFDSPVICEYLDQLEEKKALIPNNGDKRWSVLRAEALADGIMDAAYLTVMEQKRDAELQSQSWTNRLKEAIERSLDHANKSLPTNTDINIGTLSLNIALDYLDLRMPELKWRKGRKNLEKWVEKISQRSSMILTKPTP